jgi:hypothetical protein
MESVAQLLVRFEGAVVVEEPMMFSQELLVATW